MSDRATFWYIFGLAAMAVALIRWRPTWRANWRDPIALSFAIGVFASVLGVLSKQPVIAQRLDALFGANAAWIFADAFFLGGLCGLTIWIDLMRNPTPSQRRPALLVAGRVVALIGVIAYMVVAARLQAPVWGGLERGGIDVAGQPALLISRLAYLAYDLWALSYLSLRFYQLRQQLRDRLSYLRLTLAWAAVSLAALAPALQIVAVLEVFFQPALLAQIWPPVWRVVSILQVLVAVLVLSLFFEPAYRLIAWGDKQWLIYRLLRARGAVARYRPDIISDDILKPAPILARQPDQYLSTLVNDFEMMRQMMGATPDQFAVPAGSVMARDIRQELQRQLQQLQRALFSKEPFDAPTVTGDTYALARWYAHFAAVALSARKRPGRA